ncbi:MAG: hypothetical protein QNJ74_27135, partial [Trichodesmium sp. MO_231.B1]|nr:hypothetical protein [Trichodesmium sp. MO_231.B1]
PNLQFADLEANTLDELSMEELSFVSGGDGKGIYIGEFRLEVLPINKNTFVPTNPKGELTIDFSAFEGNGAEVVGSECFECTSSFPMFRTVYDVEECPAVGPCSFVHASPYPG